MSRLPEDLWLPEHLAPPKFTFAALAQCAEREAKMRRIVYRNRVNTGRMTRQMADREIDMMEAIGTLLRAMSASERLL